MNMIQQYYQCLLRHNKEFMSWLILLIIIYSTNSIINKNIISSGISPYTIQYVQCIIGTILIPFWYYMSCKFSTVALDIVSISKITFTGIISSLAFLIFLFLSSNRSVSSLSACVSSYPALTMMICYFIGAEKITIPRVIGILSIIFGIVIIQMFDK